MTRMEHCTDKEQIETLPADSLRPRCWSGTAGNSVSRPRSAHVTRRLWTHVVTARRARRTPRVASGSPSPASEARAGERVDRAARAGDTVPYGVPCNTEGPHGSRECGTPPPTARRGGAPTLPRGVVLGIPARAFA